MKVNYLRFKLVAFYLPPFTGPHLVGQGTLGLNQTPVGENDLRDQQWLRGGGLRETKVATEHFAPSPQEIVAEVGRLHVSDELLPHVQTEDTRHFLCKLGLRWPSPGLGRASVGVAFS
jgi:hypothetical protein